MNKFLQAHHLKTSDERGVMLVTILVIGMIVTFVGLSLADLVIVQYNRTGENVYRANANLVAEAGVEETLSALNDDNSFTGFNTEEEFFDDDDRGRAIYSTRVTNGPNNQKFIESTGKTYRSSGKLVSTRTVKVSLVGTSTPVPSVIAGAGGLILGGSASINNSDVQVNGFITMDGASSIGSDSHPVNVNVANANCPKGANPGPTYPQICSTGQPITIPDWGSPRILGSTCATGQTQAKFPISQYNTNPPQIRPGASGGSGLVSGCASPVMPMPTYDRAAHVSRMTTTGEANNNTYNCSNWVNPVGFVRTWPANLRLNGNVNIGSSCDLTITGDVYVTGNFTIAGGATVRIANSLGANVPKIIVDGTVTVGGGGRVITNTSGTSAQIISFKSTAPCNPICTNVTGTDLYNSRNQQNVTVNGGGSYAGLGVWAYWSKVRIEGAGLVGAVTGQTIDMQGAGNITFGTSLSSGTTIWTIRSYQRTFEEVN